MSGALELDGTLELNGAILGGALVRAVRAEAFSWRQMRPPAPSGSRRCRSYPRAPDNTPCRSYPGALACGQLLRLKTIRTSDIACSRNGVLTWQRVLRQAAVRVYPPPPAASARTRSGMSSRRGPHGWRCARSVLRNKRK